MLSQSFRDTLLRQGAALVGYADLRSFPEDARRHLPYGVSIAVSLDPLIVRGIQHGPTLAYFEEYNRVNARIDRLCRLAADFLCRKGYQAIPQDSTMKIEDGPLSTPLPHKTVATNAGLGWIGRTALLVTPQYGSAIRLGSVLTDAPLDLGVPIIQPRCGACTACSDRCPGHAATGALWECGAPRSHLLDASACQKTAIQMSEKVGLVHRSICGLCMYACPYTQRYLNEVGV